MNFIKPARKDTIFLQEGIWHFTDQFLHWASTSIMDSYEIEVLSDNILDNLSRVPNLLFQTEDDAVAYDLAWTETFVNPVPILLSSIRRVMPNIIANDITGVSSMVAPNGQIFALRARYLQGTQDGP